MALYTKDSIERVKDAVDMVELVSARSELRRVGTRYTGICPFHDDRTPSFSVDADMKLYHCFGCGESGDAIRFIETTEGLDFKQAVEHLADRYGVELKREQEDPRAEERRRRRERLLELVERTARYYARFLWEASEAAKARSYLAARGLGDDILREFGVGYAPSAWDRVLVAAQRDGFTRDELLAAGLAQRGRQGGVYDRFRSRIMFPLADPRGRVLGFGARAVREDQRPKYLNTSENELYHKGRQLFGIDRARAAAAKAGRIIAVEGYTDVLALHQAGLCESVAIMGTALTGEQLDELGRAAGRTVYLALDADSSGREAMLRAARLARERRLDLLVINLPRGSDPADLIASEGADAFRIRLDDALSVPEFETRRVLEEADLRTPRGRDRAIGQLRPVFAALPRASATRDELARQAADRLDVPREYLETRFTDLERPHEPTREAAPPRAARIDPIARAERDFLAMCVSRPDAGRAYLEHLRADHFTSDELRRARDHLLDHWDDPLDTLPDDDAELKAVVCELAMRGRGEAVRTETLRLTFLQLELRRVERGLQRAARTGDLETLRSLAPTRQGIRSEIGELIGAAQ